MVCCWLAFCAFGPKFQIYAHTYTEPHQLRKKGQRMNKWHPMRGNSRFMWNDTSNSDDDDDDSNKGNRSYESKTPPNSLPSRVCRTDLIIIDYCSFFLSFNEILFFFLDYGTSRRNEKPKIAFVHTLAHIISALIIKMIQKRAK